ncbi:MAG: ABC transporter ATP-binding protein [Candidatus Ancillula sp.]|jgi:peptide/nickel transport system ATP-binding protein|nr:ABC transporter ATP-binding protein [Candidatus Ancillula sp.]
MTDVVRLDNLRVRFSTDNGDVDAVKNVSLNVREREILAIVGESGSGKSVSTKTILQMLPDYAIEDGAVLLKSSETGKLRDVTSLGYRELREIRGQDASMVFQEPSNALNPVYRVGWQIAEGIRAHLPKGEKLSKAQAKEKAIEIMRTVGIPDPEVRVNYYPHQFSGGQKQRIVIAQALVLGAKLIIADEPTTALDVTVQAEILELLKSIRDEFGTSILLITHNMGVVADMADRVVVMSEGAVVEENDVFKLFAVAENEYTRALLAAVPRIDAATRRVNTRKNPLTSQNEVICVKGLTVEYPAGFGVQSFKAVDNISFSIRKGEVLGLVGESGSGKSTTGRALINLVKSKGDISLFGQDVRKLNKKQMTEVMRKVGYIFQDPASSFNPLQTIGEAIAEPLLIAGKGDPSGFGVSRYEEALPRVERLLGLVHLPAEFCTRFPHELSGGQRQRVGFARALALQPEIIIADEPTSALDVSVQAEVLKLFLELQDRLQFSCLFITHDLAVVDMVSDTIAVMQKGKIVEMGTGEQILTNPGQDYTKQLLKSLPLPDPQLQRAKD